MCDCSLAGEESESEDCDGITCHLFSFLIVETASPVNY